jgi:hypothetical protein
MEELGHFQFPGNVYRSLRHGPCIIMLKHEVMMADEWYDNGPQDLVTVSLCIQIAYACLPAHTITPPSAWGTLFTTLSANRSPTQVCRLPGTVKTWINP